MQLPALQIAKREGWTVAVVDGNAHAAGRNLADTFGHVDLRDRDGLVVWANAYRQRHRLDGVFTAGTDFSTSVAYVAEQLGLPGIPFETARDASDKERMRQRFAEAGVPSTPFFAVRDEIDPSLLSSKAREIGFPVVVKPVDNMGARGVVRIDTGDRLAHAVKEARRYSGDGRVLVERFIDGPEFSIDAVVHNGEVVICGVADRDIRFPPWFIEIGHTMPTNCQPALRRELERVFSLGVRALGITSGAAKGDVFLSPHGPVIGEIAARLSGGYMSGWTYPYSSGIEPTLAAMRIALGLPPGDLVPVREYVSAERALLSIPGIVREVEGFDRARSIPGVRDVFERVVAGDRVVFPRNNVEKCGNVIASAKTRSAALEAALQAIRAIYIRLEPAVDETERFLWGNVAQEGQEPDGGGGSMHAGAFYPGIAASSVALPRIGTKSDSGSSADAQVGAQVDYCGRTLSETLSVLRHCAGFPLLSELPYDAPGRRRFWSAVARGGLQGGRFFLDTIHEDPTARERVCFA
ncbi:MAG: ATP-grasp domain-containing protein [Spirochaetaceae bacterium]|nr:MAG: ATP-grasp domain-containing protein [Spirochaetaceae bacterium]